MDKSALLADRVTTNTREVEIPGVGTITVRGLTRFELILAGKGTDDALVIERRNVAMAMVDPQMSEGDVAAWQRASPAGELAEVTIAIRDLSGLGEGAGKSDVSEVRE